MGICWPRTPGHSQRHPQSTNVYNADMLAEARRERIAKREESKKKKEDRKAALAASKAEEVTVTGMGGDVVSGGTNDREIYEGT